MTERESDTFNLYSAFQGTKGHAAEGPRPGVKPGTPALPPELNGAPIFYWKCNVFSEFFIKSVSTKQNNHLFSAFVDSELCQKVVLYGL